MVMDEQVYNRYYDTGGNYHWIGVHSGEHIVRKGEKMRFKERNELANRCKEWMKDQQNNITTPLDTVHMVLAYLDVNGYLNEVVRCKDCRYWQEYQEGHYPNELCPWDKNETTDEDDYCSFGERRQP